MAANNGWDQEHVHDVASHYVSTEPAAALSGSNGLLATPPRHFSPQGFRPRGDFRGKDDWRSRGRNMHSRPYQPRGPPQFRGSGDYRGRPPQNNFWNQRGGVPPRGGSHYEQHHSFRPQRPFNPRGRFDRGRSGGRGNFRRPYNQHSGGGQSGFHQQNGQLPISAYFHPSMLEDPWAAPEPRQWQQHEAPSSSSSQHAVVEVEPIASDDAELQGILKEMKKDNGDSTPAGDIGSKVQLDGSVSEPVTAERDQVSYREITEGASNPKDNSVSDETAMKAEDDNMEPPQLIPHETNDPVPHQITE
ncbi:hypothetical protein RvY_09971 [Ramazzottius varieornatus]|uniref:Uncharacterized protein n=1 Tax=Ramazzottius varieornatus TaxID=947166 RepID=A0A1D1VK68_RAMVA|nr:hypothetical protein RvY_09971 [Ramazzottius varieornatus]